MSDIPDFVRRQAELRPEEPTPPDKLAAVRDKARALRNLYTKLSWHEEQIAELNRAINTIEQKELLDLMSEAAMSQFALEPEGNYPAASFEKATVVNASIPEDKLTQALVWLEEEGHADLIKYEFKVKFNMGAHESAKKLEAVLKKGLYDYSSKIGVLPQTLTAFVKRELAANHVVPNDLLGVYVGEKVNVALGGEKVKKRKK